MSFVFTKMPSGCQSWHKRTLKFFSVPNGHWSASVHWQVGIWVWNFEEPEPLKEILKTSNVNLHVNKWGRAERDNDVEWGQGASHNRTGCQILTMALCPYGWMQSLALLEPFFTEPETSKSSGLRVLLVSFKPHEMDYHLRCTGVSLSLTIPKYFAPSVNLCCSGYKPFWLNLHTVCLPPMNALNKKWLFNLWGL